MNLIKEDFRNRAGEITEFINLIKFIETTDRVCDENENTHEINISLKNTLKGNVFLLLYNLIESTMRESISHIHEKLEDKEVLFDQLRIKLKKEILHRIKSEKIGIESLFNKINNDISKHLMRATFRKKDIFSGNVDHKEICKQAKIYGFDTTTEYEKTKHGGNLETIKDKRNDLAHGNVSFSEIGQNYSHDDLAKFSQEIIHYLESITTHISNYLDRQEYLMS